MVKLQYKGRINNMGKLEIFHKERMNSDLRNFVNKDVTLTIDAEQKVVTNKQIAYWYGVIIPHCQDGYKRVGDNYTKKQVEDIINNSFLYEERVDEQTGEITKVPLTLKNGEINRKVFSLAVDRVKMFAAEWLGAYIPDSNERI